MPTLTVRKLSDEVHRALRARAAMHGRSTEAEVRAILENAVRPEGRVKLGSLLADIGRRANLTDDEFAVFVSARLRPRAHSPAAGLNHPAVKVDINSA